MTVLSQIFKLIPRNLIPKITNDFGVDKQSRNSEKEKTTDLWLELLRMIVAESAGYIKCFQA